MSASNPPLLPEVKIGARQTGQDDLDLASAGVQRYLWQGVYGAMLIEVRDGAAFVNGDRVASIQELHNTNNDGSLRTLR
jgi:hypothetical protein